VVTDRFGDRFVLKRRADLAEDETAARPDPRVADALSRSPRALIAIYSDMVDLDSSEAVRLTAADLHGAVSYTVLRALARGDYVRVAKPARAASRPATTYHPGPVHNHLPSGKWAEIQKNPNSSGAACIVCAHADPAWVLRAAIAAEFTFKPIGLKHLNWFLADGHGADYVEDANIDTLLRQDAQVQRLFKQAIVARGARGVQRGHIGLRQDNYSDSDFQYAFGSIDRFDFEADTKAGTFHGWFKDRYEWHPVYPGLYVKLAGDVVRETNCVHAAAVELKSGTARDYWMVGEATIPLAMILGVPPGPTSR
jgi:hypothetical protein